jgi:hypothetical protein
MNVVRVGWLEHLDRAHRQQTFGALSNHYSRFPRLFSGRRGERPPWLSIQCDHWIHSDKLEAVDDTIGAVYVLRPELLRFIRDYMGRDTV